MNYKQRQENLMRAMSEKKLDALVVTHMANINYLCGFTGSSGALVARAPHWSFFTDGRYTAQAHQEVRGAHVAIVKGPPLIGAAIALGKAVRRAALGIEADHLTVAGRRAFAAALPPGIRIRDTAGMVEKLRMIKEPEEIERIRAAVLAGAALLKPAVAAIAPGVSETGVAAKIEYAARQAGADGMSFETIVAAGPRSALPHGRASSQPIPRRGFVVMDFGVILRGYCSDMTRTVHVGRPPAAMRSMYEAVLEAQLAGIQAVRAGVDAGSVDRAARRTLRAAGMARFFTHSTGHGVGLEIHEAPRLARDGTDVLQAGMVITIEPGVYIPGKGGVRIEDMLVVTEGGAQVLTPAPKELLVI
jgi:Xaa-Pro aminopeptidase